MAITREEIKKLANLARIKLSDEEERALVGDMENILKYVGEIKNVSVTTESSSDQKKTEKKIKKEIVRNVLRDDNNPHESGINTETLLSEAPKREGQYIKVKKIL